MKCTLFVGFMLILLSLPFGEGWGGALFAQNLAGGSYDGSHMAQVSPCAATVYTNIFIGGSYDGENMAQVSPCAATVYTNIFIGGSYDGENMAQVSPCAPTVYSNFYNKGGSYDGENMVQVSPCAATVYSNIFIGGSCGGEYASVSECPSETWIYPTCATRPELDLPIELLKFTAKPIDNKYVLTEWVTATEINNDYFTVEKTKDDRVYQIIGTQKGAGNSTRILYYAMTDYAPYQGISYYRLKQTDYDGKFTYSQLVPVNLNGVDIISISPNPAIDNFEYKIGSTEKMSVQVKVLDILGQIVINQTENIEKGITSKRLDVSGISSGTYILELITENKEVRGKQFQIK